jgi:hypothetical protein
VREAQVQPLALQGHLSPVQAVEGEWGMPFQTQEPVVQVALGAAGLDQISHRPAAEQVVSTREAEAVQTEACLQPQVLAAPVL